MIIGLMGQKGSGKDTVGLYMCQHYGFTRVSFADALKRTVKDLLGVEYDGVDKEEYLPPYDSTRRELWQAFGVAARGVYADIWAQAAFRNVDMTKNIVVTDVRFKNEVDYIRNCPVQSVLLRVTRDSDSDDAHVSEMEWRSIVPDIVFDNNETVERLHRRISTLMKVLKVNRASLL